MGVSEEEEMMTMMMMMRYVNLTIPRGRGNAEYWVHIQRSIKMFVLLLKTTLLKVLPSHRPPLINASRVPAVILILYHPFVLLKTWITKKRRPAREDEARLTEMLT